MGGVQSLDRGEIVAFNLGPPAIASTPVEKLLGDTGVINVLKVPKVRNENWERAKPAFKPLLEEALQIRATILKEGRGLHRGKLETALGRTRKSTPGPGGTRSIGSHIAQRTGERGRAHGDVLLDSRGGARTLTTRQLLE